MAAGGGDVCVNYSDFIVQEEDRRVLPWDRFSHWITCFCVVTFDLELGQVIEKTYPEHVHLTEKEKANICYLAFPDSNTGCMGDTQFHFRIRSTSKLPTKKGNIISEKDVPVVLQKDPMHFYGFVYFRQVKDASLKRGYFQKSVVLLSRLPYISLFSCLVQLAAPEYFENGDAALETVCHQIDKWSPQSPGQTIQLPVLGNVFQVRIPSRKDKPGAVASPEIEQLKQISIPSPLILPSLNEVNIYKCLAMVLPHVHLLWELVLLGEPIVVMAPSPDVCSETVQALTRFPVFLVNYENLPYLNFDGTYSRCHDTCLIQPLKYSSDYRPYFTIHDTEFKEYTTKTQTPPSIILGVTNPFFAKTLQRWPHIVRIGDMPTLTISRPGTSTASSRKEQQLKPGIYTKYRPTLERDKLIFKNLSKGSSSKRPLEAQNALLRRHFVELTQSFMIPLERYISSLMPLQRSISPWRAVPKLKRFNVEEFLRTLGNFGPQLTSKLRGNWTILYRKFFLSPNFESWFKNRREEINQKLEILHLEALCSADILKWIDARDEIEIVDLYMQLKRSLAKVRSRDPPLSVDMRRQLKAHMERILETLPTDLQLVLRQS